MGLTLEEIDANRKAWVAALRSGKYEQCHGALKNGIGYCCLGVLAEISGYDWSSWSLEDDQVASPTAMAFVGLNTSVGDLEYNGASRSLAGLNDSGETFAKIADIIEREPTGLFVEEVQS